MDKKEFDFIKDGVDTSTTVFTDDGVKKGKSERVRELLEGLTYPTEWTKETEEAINGFIQAGYSNLQQENFNTGNVKVTKDGEEFLLDTDGNVVDTADFADNDNDFEK